MSNHPAPSDGNNVRRVITGCLLGLALLCVGWIVGLEAFSQTGGFGKTAQFVLPVAALDILALIALGLWVLRPPAPGAIDFLGLWIGKVLLFLGLGAAIVVFFFATCLFVL